MMGFTMLFFFFLGIGLGVAFTIIMSDFNDSDYSHQEAFVYAYDNDIISKTIKNKILYTMIINNSDFQISYFKNHNTKYKKDKTI